MNTQISSSRIARMAAIGASIVCAWLPVAAFAWEPIYDFGGMYGFHTVGNTTVPYTNPATGAASCPSGYTAQQMHGTYGLDYNAYYCYRTHTATSVPLYDFGGMYGFYQGAGYGIYPYNNPATGTTSCPTGYTARQVLGTNGLDFNTFYCYRPHVSGSLGTYHFGGMYGFYQGAGYGIYPYNNPATGKTSCLSGYTAQQVAGTNNLDFPIAFCYRVSGT